MAWYWEVDGHEISREQNPSNVFPSSGTYAVTLTVTNANGLSDRRTRYIPVEILNIPPVADFEMEEEIYLGEVAYIYSTSYDPDGENREMVVVNTFCSRGC